jgi:hypothetical protein
MSAFVFIIYLYNLRKCVIYYLGHEKTSWQNFVRTVLIFKSVPKLSYTIHYVFPCHKISKLNYLFYKFSIMYYVNIILSQLLNLMQN